MKLQLSLLSIFWVLLLNAQEVLPSQQFWSQLQGLCGKSFEGKLITPENDAQFAGKNYLHNVNIIGKG